MGTILSLPRKKEQLLKKIKAYRLMHGLSQRKMAKALGVDSTTLARWERGKSTPGKKLKELITALIDGGPSNNNAVV